MAVRDPYISKSSALKRAPAGADSTAVFISLKVLIAPLSYPELLANTREGCRRSANIGVVSLWLGYYDLLEYDTDGRLPRWIVDIRLFALLAEAWAPRYRARN